MTPCTKSGSLEEKEGLLPCTLCLYTFFLCLWRSEALRLCLGNQVLEA